MCPQGEELRDCVSPGHQLRQRWNADPDLDLRCMEAVKLHMLAEAVQLERDQARTDQVRREGAYRRGTAGGEVPIGYHGRREAEGVGRQRTAGGAGVLTRYGGSSGVRQERGGYRWGTVV